MAGKHSYDKDEEIPKAMRKNTSEKVNSNMRR